MSSELQITFRGMAPSEMLRDVAHQKFEKTVRQLEPSARCRVVLDRPIGSQRKGAPVRAHVELRGPVQGVRISVLASHVDAASAVREAFQRIQRQVNSLERTHSLFP